MASAKMKISFNIESVIKLKCLNSDCIHNLYNRGFAGCNLKYIEIDVEGACLQYESIEVREAKKRGLANDQ